MLATILGVEYFNTTIRDQPGEAYHFLSQLAAAQINLLAFSAIPIGPAGTQVVLFPENPQRLLHAAKQRDLHLAGPERAFLIQGDDQLGAFAEIHKRLSDEDINVYASSGVTDGRGGYGYVLYVRPEDYDRAARVLGA